MTKNALFLSTVQKIVGPGMFLTGRRMWTTMKQIQKNLSKNKEKTPLNGAATQVSPIFGVLQVTKSTHTFYVV